MSRYRPQELALQILAFGIVVAGVVMLQVTGPKGLGWLLLPLGMFLSLAVGYRAKKRLNAQDRKLPNRSEELDYRDGQ